MATEVQTVVVPSPELIESTLAGYISQGFSVQSRTGDSVTLFKKKEFSILWLVIGLMLSAIPLLVYLIIYAQEKDKMVIIRVATPEELAASTAALPAQGELTWSTDRTLWWDGAAWQDPTTTIPPSVQFSEDNNYWWDGESWRPVPGAVPEELPTTLPQPDVGEPS